jgi:AcrR family transcriptional regulator
MTSQEAANNRPKRHLEIIDISAELFARNGFNAVGVAQISEAVGLGRGALYHYIGSKDQLLIDIQERVLGPINWCMDETLNLKKGPLVGLRLISHFLLEIMTQRLAHVWVYQHDYRSLDGDERKKFVERRSRIEIVVRDLIAEAMTDRLFGKGDAQLRALEFFNHHNYTYQWFRLDGQWSAAELSAQYCRTLMTGFGCSAEDLQRCEEISRAEIEKLTPRFVQEIG